MPDLVKFSLVDRSHSTKNLYCPRKIQRRENSTMSKFFDVLMLFCLFVWLVNIARPAQGRIIQQNQRERRSYFSIDPKAVENIENPNDQLTGKLFFPLIRFNSKPFLKTFLR